VPESNPFVRAGWYTALGINFSGTIGGGAVVGWLIDRWLGSPPWGLVVCTILGVVGGFIWLIQALRQLERRERES
jgi:F0F1-type ATP synthase assembly protein I